MSTQSGSDGYGKVRKSCQTGGASGWAKHCGSTDDHKKSNRLERKLGKQEMDGEVPAPRMRSTRRRDKVPTRRHLVQRLEHVTGEIKKWDDDKAKHLKDRPNCKGCMMYCDDRWFSKWRYKQRDQILKEFEKYGYEKP